MKESKAVYVTKHKIRNDRNLIYQLYTQCDRNCKRNGKNNDASCQFDSKRDVCTCRNLYRRDCFNRLPKQIYAYHRSRSYTEIGVGSVKALQKRRVRRVYLPETDDRGVGSSDLSSYIMHKKKCLTSYYDQKKTSSKCVGGIIEYNTGCALSEKCSPIITTKSGSTSPKSTVQLANNEIGSNTIDKKVITVSTQFEVAVKESLPTVHKKEQDSSPGDVIPSTKKQSETTQIYKPSNIIEDKKKALENRMKEDEKFSSDSLVQHVHNLEIPCEEKPSKGSLDPMENKLEREYRKIFTTKSKESKDSKPSCEQNLSEYKSASILRRRFQALRRGLTKKDEMKKGSFARKSSSHDSLASHKDASVTSDPPSLVGRSFSSTTKKYSPILAHPVEQDKISPPYKTQKDSVYTNEVDSDYQGVKGMFKLWGKKFNLEEEYYKKKITPMPSYDVPAPSVKLVKPNKSRISTEKPFHISANQSTDKKHSEKEPKKEKKFFFFRKKKKIEPKASSKDPYPTKKAENVTAGRCEVAEGFKIKVGRPNTLPPKHIASKISEESDEISRKRWLRRFISSTMESARSVNIRWNNTMYATSSSTVFELIDTVYKNTEIFIHSRSEVTSLESYYQSNTKNKVNFVQDIEAWMIPQTILDRPEDIPVKINTAKNIKPKVKLSISDQNWMIDKRSRKHTVEVFLQSNKNKSGTKVSSEYLRIDIPKNFFDSISSEDSKRNQTSDEEVYKIVEYESDSERKKGKKKPLEKGDTHSDIKIIVNVQDSNNLESKILETVIKRPPMHRDVIIQGSNVNIPKRFDVIEVGIITQRDLREIQQSIIKIREDSSENDSMRGTPLLKQKKCEFAESYLQEYYRHWTPLGVDLYSCASDPHLKSCSEKSFTSFHTQGDGSKSCPNMYEDYLTSAIMSSCTTSSITPPSLLVAQQGCCDAKDALPSKFFKMMKKPKPASTPQSPDKNSLFKRVLPKDSLEVFRRRKIYAHSMKDKWHCAEDKPVSVPSFESKCQQDGCANCPPKLEKPVRYPSKIRESSKKRVCLPDCETMNNSLATQLCDKGPEGILNFKGSATTVKKPKHTCIIPEPSGEIPIDTCKGYCNPRISPSTRSSQSCNMHFITETTSPVSSGPVAYPCSSPTQLLFPMPLQLCPQPQLYFPQPLQCPHPTPCPPSRCPASSPACRTAPASLPPPMCHPLPQCPNLPPPQCPPNPVFIPPRRCPPPISQCLPQRPCPPQLCYIPPCRPPPCRPPPCRPPPCTPPAVIYMPKKCSPPLHQLHVQTPSSVSQSKCPTPHQCPHTPPCPRSQSPPRETPPYQQPPSSPTRSISSLYQSEVSCSQCKRKIKTLSKGCSVRPPSPPSPPQSQPMEKSSSSSSCTSQAEEVISPRTPQLDQIITIRPSIHNCPHPPKPPRPQKQSPCGNPPCSRVDMKFVPPPKNVCSSAASTQQSPSTDLINKFVFGTDGCKDKCPLLKIPSYPSIEPYVQEKPSSPKFVQCPEPEPLPMPGTRSPIPPCTPCTLSPPRPKCPYEKKSASKLKCPFSRFKSKPECPPPPCISPLCQSPPRPRQKSPPRSRSKTPPRSQSKSPPRHRTKSPPRSRPKTPPPSMCPPPPPCPPTPPICPSPTPGCQPPQPPPPICLPPVPSGCQSPRPPFSPPKSSYPPSKPPSPPRVLSNHKTKPKPYGLFLRKSPSKKKTCAKECSAWEVPVEPYQVVKLNSTEKITIKLKQNTPSTEELREKMDIKVQDEDGATLYERKDYVCRRQSSLLEGMYKNENINRVSTPIMITNLTSEPGPETKLQSEASLNNLIEIEFKLRITQGDKTTEINIGKDEPKNMTNLNAQLSKCETYEPEVYNVKEDDDEVSEDTTAKNDISIKIIVKNYKPKTEKQKENLAFYDKFTKKISEKFHTVSTGYSDVYGGPPTAVDNLSLIVDKAGSTVHFATSHENCQICSIKDEVKKQQNTQEQTCIKSKESIYAPSSNEEIHIIVTEEESDKNTKTSQSCEMQDEGNMKLNFSTDNIKTNDTKIDQDDLETTIQQIETQSKANSRKEKKELLKKVFQEAHDKPKNKDRVRQLREMLKIILTDSSENDDIVTVASNELAKNVTYTSLKPNYFRDTDSMNNYYKIESSDSSKNESLREKTETHTDENNSEDTDKHSYISIENDHLPPPKGCMCSRVVEKINIPELNISCCCRKQTKQDTEINCNLYEELSQIEYCDAITQNSSFSKDSRNNVSPSASFKASKIKSLVSYRNYKECSRSVQKIALENSYMNEDKIVFMNRESKNRGRQKKYKEFNPADVLQCYETKKAVLEIYAEKTYSENGEHLVAKLPKFLHEKESEIERNYDKIATNSYMSVCTKNIFVMSVGR